MAEISWIKLSTGLPDNKKIKRIRKLPDGNKVILFWVFLLARAGESNKSGGLFLTDTMPYQEEDLAADFDFTVEFVQFALITLEKYSMITKYEKVLFIKNWEEYQAVEGMEKVRLQNRERQARFKAKQKELTSTNVSGNVTDNGEITPDNATEEEKEIEKEIDKDKDIEVEPLKNNPTNSLSVLSDFYQGNFGVINPLVLDDLNHSLNDFGVELTLEAMKRTLRNQKPFSYSLRILNAWAKNNIKTLADVQADDAKFERAKGKGKSSKVVKQAPEWSQKKYVDNTSDQQKAEFEAYKAKRKETKDASS